MSTRHFFLALCFVLCFCGSSEALMFIGPSGFCSSCTPLDAGVVCEPFEGSTDGGGCDFYRCAGWSEVVDATYGSISCGAATGTTVCTDHGSNVLKVAQTYDATNTGTYAEYTLATATPSPQIVFDFNLVSEGLANTQKMLAVEILNATPGRLAGLFIYQDGGGVLRFRLEADGGTSKNCTITAISTGQHYSLRLVFIDSTSFALYVNGVEEWTISDMGATADVKYVRFGSLVDASYTYSYEFDNIKIDSDGTPTGCSGGTW